MTPHEELPDGDGCTRRDILKGGVALAGTAGLSAFLAACGSSGSRGSSGVQTANAGTLGGKPKRGGHLVVGLSDGGGSDVLEPWNTSYYSAACRAQQVYERLFNYNSEGIPVPRLAVAAESDKTAMTWRIKLRDGVTFHNGKTLTAADVLYSWRYVADPKHNADALSRLQPVDLNASKVLSPTEVEFKMRRPIGDFKTLAAEKNLWIVPDGYTDFNKPMGTGPFTYKSSQIGVKYLFERNPHYWETGAGGGPPWLDSLEIQIITDATARLNALLGGQIQEMTFLPFINAKQYQGSSQITVVRAKQPNATAVYMVIDAPQFSNPKVRLAMKTAIDRQALVNDILLGYGSIGNDLWGKGQNTYNSDLPQHEYDPEKASSLLKAAGVSSLNLTLPTADAAPGMIQSAVGFKQTAAKAGINVTLQKIDAGTYFANHLYMKVPFYETQWAQGFESQALDALTYDAPYNETHWYSKSWTHGLWKAEGILDEAKRIQAYKDLQEPLWAQGGYIIWGVYETVDATSPNVRGIVPSIANGFSNLGNFDFKYHWLA